MKEIIAIINQKGGVGKSTTALALGAGLILKGYQVLQIDLDAQGNLSSTMKATRDGLSVLEALTRAVKIEKIIQHTDQGDVLPSSQALAGMDAILTSVGKEYRLKEALALVKDKYDYVIIDTPPALGILTINALVAASAAVIPAQADAFSLSAIGQLYCTIQVVREYCNKELEIKGILLTRHNPKTILSRETAEVMAQTAESIQTRLFKTTIREAVAVKEAQASQQDIYSYAPNGNATKDYWEFIEELFNDSSRP